MGKSHWETVVSGIALRHENSSQSASSGWQVAFSNCFRDYRNVCCCNGPCSRVRLSSRSFRLVCAHIYNARTDRACNLRNWPLGLQGAACLQGAAKTMAMIRCLVHQTHRFVDTMSSWITDRIISGEGKALWKIDKATGRWLFFVSGCLSTTQFTVCPWQPRAEVCAS